MALSRVLFCLKYVFNVIAMNEVFLIVKLNGLKTCKLVNALTRGESETLPSIKPNEIIKIDRITCGWFNNWFLSFIYLFVCLFVSDNPTLKLYIENLIEKLADFKENLVRILNEQSFPLCPALQFIVKTSVLSQIFDPNHVSKCQDLGNRPRCDSGTIVTSIRSKILCWELVSEVSKN